MNTTLSLETPTARKEHRCLWCGEMIAKGQTYSRWTGIYEGKLQSNPMHAECAEACANVLRDGWDDDYTPYEHMRGTECERGCTCELHK